MRELLDGLGDDVIDGRNGDWLQGLRAPEVPTSAGGALSLSLKNRPAESQAYLCQILKSIHQNALDNGSWEVENSLLPGEDPCGRPSHAVSEAELEKIVSYQEAMKKLKARKGDRDEDGEGNGGGKGARKGGAPNKDN